MRKLDKLIIRNFIGPFVLTTLVVVFLFLLRFLMLYFDDFVGKDLGLPTFGKLFGYFSLITVPIALPLSTLLASLMAFGNLGEHTELTAMKSAGIPLVRILLPAFVFALGISVFSFWYNNNVTPWANLKGYSLLWDVRTTKLALNIEEGIFYREIPGYAIKVKEKMPDNETLRGVLVYDHTDRNGNKNVTVADSGKMYTIMGDHYLVFELFNGLNYTEKTANGGMNDTPYFRNRFKKNKIVFSLESFNMSNTSENQFKYHEYMKNISELKVQIDSTEKEVKKQENLQLSSLKSMYTYQFRVIPPQIKIDSMSGDSVKSVILPGPWIQKKIKELDNSGRYSEIWALAQSNCSTYKSQLQTSYSILSNKKRGMYSADLELWHKITYAIACLAMFIIGASIGSIIKKGGFGMPVLIAISFFILYYVLLQLTDKNAKEGFLPVLIAVWIPDFILLSLGIWLSLKATKDARLFESDFYAQLLDKIKKKRAKNIAQGI